MIQAIENYIAIELKKTGTITHFKNSSLGKKIFGDFFYPQKAHFETFPLCVHCRGLCNIAALVVNQHTTSPQPSGLSFLLGVNWSKSTEFRSSALLFF
jgi:hypothetical protein